MLRTSIRIAAMVAAAGAAGTAMASVSVTPTDVITWGGVGTGRSLAAVQPSGLTWAWGSTRSTGVAIDSNGRVYWQGQYTQTPVVGSIAAASHRGLFTATNSTDIANFDGIYDGGTKDGLNLRNGTSTVGGTSTTAPRISGTKVGFGLQFSGGSPAIIESGVGTNNTAFYIGDSAGTGRAAQQADTVTVNDTAGTPTSVLMNTALKSISQQNSEINSSGTLVAWMTVPTAAGTGSPLAGQFVATANAAAAPFGNTAFLATKTVGGAYDIIVQGGQSAPGVTGGRFQNGGNGANGFFAKINRNGQVAFDGKLVTTFPVTTGSDDVLYIHTPGVGKQLIRREGQVAPDSTGSADTGGSLYSGGISGSRGFSNAGILFHSSLTGGDVVTTAGIANSSGMYIGTTTGTTRVYRQNDPAPGLPAGVNFGSTVTSNFNFNNNGQISLGNFLQGPGVTADVGPTLSGGFPGVPAVVTTPGIQGNSAAFLAGTAGNLQVIARTGDAAPGFNGLYHNLVINNGSLVMNNRGDVLFQGDTTTYAAGETIGVAGELASTSIRPAGPSVLWGWSQTYGLLPMFYTNQQIEVDPGVFKFISQITVHNADNGDGGASGLNDDGKFVVSLAFTDNTWAYVTAQIPAPGTGAMALLGLGTLSRRRRR